MPLGLPISGAAALAAYTELDESSVISHISAAVLWGIPLPNRLREDWRIHVARPPGYGMPRRANVVGHTLDLSDQEIFTFDGVRVTSPDRTWLDLASILTVPDLVAAGDYLVCGHDQEFPRPQRAITSLSDLDDQVRRHAGGRGVRRAREAFGLTRVGSDSVPETMMRLALVNNGLPEPQLNWVLADSMGRPVLWPDAAYVRWKISIQYDGLHHGEPGQHQRDIRRADVTAQLGWSEVRVSSADLANGGRPLVKKVRAALCASGWTPETAVVVASTTRKRQQL